jgi:hypothetical protein
LCTFTNGKRQESSYIVIAFKTICSLKVVKVVYQIMAESANPVVRHLCQGFVSFRRQQDRDGDVALQQRSPVRLDVL